MDSRIFKIVAFCLGLLLLGLAGVLALSLLCPFLGINLQWPFLDRFVILELFYGLSSFAIPVIVLFYAVVLIALPWNACINFISAGTPVYFFTFVFFERLANFLCRTFSAYNIENFINVTTLIFALLLVALEIALCYLFGEKLDLVNTTLKVTEPCDVDIVACDYNSEITESLENGLVKEGLTNAFLKEKDQSLKLSTSNKNENLTTKSENPTSELQNFEPSKKNSELSTLEPSETPKPISQNESFSPLTLQVDSTHEPTPFEDITPKSSLLDSLIVLPSTESELEAKRALEPVSPSTQLEARQPSELKTKDLEPTTSYSNENTFLNASRHDTTTSHEPSFDNTNYDESSENSEDFELEENENNTTNLISSEIESKAFEEEEGIFIDPFETEDSRIAQESSSFTASDEKTFTPENEPSSESSETELLQHTKDPNLTQASVLTTAEEYSDKASEAPKVKTAGERQVPYEVASELLTEYPGNEYWIIDERTRRDARILKETLSEFKIDVEVKGITKGPVVTMFELMPPPGIKLSKITSLQDNIALRLAAPSVRIVAPIPGKEAVGIEVPNANRAIVSMRELIETDVPQISKMAIPVLLGKDITGRPQTMDIAQTPHLLIAGATGSGKSVCVNSIILSILYNKTPDEVKLLLVDPKIVELKLYNGIAHLLTPVITEPKKAFQALQYCLCEMERRYALLDTLSVRDIKSYNAKVKRENTTAEILPYIVIIIDEFADLMVTTGKELESTVARLCAMSRAVGIHLVLATQRPSINVITGLIKANIPTRIAFMVASNADSRIILDESGAEKLLGKGDMLYVSITNPFPVRIQGTFVSDDDVERVVERVKELRTPEYIDEEIFLDDDEETEDVFIGDSDPLYDKALEIVLLEGKASASYLQRRLKIGYNRAARIVEEMESRGVVGPANGSKPRDIL